MKQLICERCSQPINSIEDGYVEWYNQVYDKDLQAFDFILVHHRPASPFGSCYINTGHNHHLGIFVKGYQKYKEEYYREILRQAIQPEDRKKLREWNILLSNKPVKTERNVPQSIRFKVLKRDEYKCQLCGITAKGGALLEVDHIQALANGGTNEMSNLWTLCDSCNRGKSDKDL
jgi:5-methylcytosine-specific restriction endonuclease McrA